MKKPVLVIMAAGMGSRYGGFKQIEPVDDQGHIIIDFSIYDAIHAGFEKIVFIIKKESEKEFREAVGARIDKYAEVVYVYQELDNLPEGFQVPAGRRKPWGTGHAVLSCYDAVTEPFAVINADDYYGRRAFKTIYDFLSANEDEQKPYRYAMVGYVLENTLTDNGYVSRGVCQTGLDGLLMGIHERTQIVKRDGGAYFTEDNGDSWIQIPEGSIVSMNMWGFGRSILEELRLKFSVFLENALLDNPEKAEYFLPTVVGELLEENKAHVSVLTSQDKWYGITYQEDRETVVNAIRTLKTEGLYPEKLWN